MSEFRIKNGLALGPFGGQIAYTNSTTGVQFAVAATGPDVTTGVLFLTNNTSTTLINTFQANRNAILGGAEEIPDGKVLVICFQDDSTSLSTSRNIYLSSTIATFQSGAVLGLIGVNSAWYEMFRSQNFKASQTTRTEIATYSVANSFGVDVQFARVINLISTAANSVLQSFSNGVAYQEITVLPIYAPGSTLFITNSGNILIGGTGAVVMDNSAAYKFIFSPTGGGTTVAKWMLIKDPPTN